MKKINSDELKALLDRTPLSDEELEHVTGGKDSYSYCLSSVCGRYKDDDDAYETCKGLCAEATQR